MSKELENRFHNFGKLVRDFCRKKECVHFLNLILTYNDPELERTRIEIIDEAEQIRKILSTIISKLESRNTA